MAEEQEVEEGIEIEKVDKGAQRAHSYSRLNCFDSCPHLYKAVYIDRIYPEGNSIMTIGAVVHDGIRRYNQHCIKHKIEHDFPMWEKFIWEAIEEENLNANHHDDCLALMKQYCETHEVSLDSVVGAEEQVSINRDGKEVEWMATDVWFRGIIDYLQISGNIAKITDYKTGWAMNVDKFQLEIYAWIIKKLYPQVTDFQIEIDYVRHEYQSTMILSEADLPRIEKKILNRIAHVEKETEFKPKVGLQCSYCPKWQSCPAMKVQEMKFKMPTNGEEAIAVALELEKADRQNKELKKLLKEYCDKFGTIEAGGRTFGFKASAGYDFDDITKLYQALDEVGCDLFEYVNIDNRRFKTALTNDAVKKVAETLGTKKVSVAFAIGKVKKDGKDED